MTLVLASTSAARRAMLKAAGVPHEAVAANVDEGAARQAFGAQGLKPRDLADALAELKAVRISQRTPGMLVLGADQMLAAEDGRLFDKPESRADAAAQLDALRGRTHRLLSAAVIAENGVPVWRAADEARLTMRGFSDAFRDSYLNQEWPAVSGCVGCYRLEGLGVQLFSRIQGDHFTILGLPLLPVLDFLRTRGMMAS